MKKETERAALRALSRLRPRDKKKIAFAVAAVLLAAVFAALILVDRLAFPLDLLWAYARVSAPPSANEGELRVHFLDVGQGDCTVVEFPDGKTMMIDGGDGNRENSLSVLGYCIGLGIGRFDYMLLTHTDTDHAGGLDDALSFFGADVVYGPWCENEEVNEAYSDFLRAGKKTGAQMRISQLYETIVSDSRENFYYAMILSPFSPESEESYYHAANAGGQGADSQAVNDASAVLYIEYAGRRILLTGDASSEVEDRLVRDFTETDGAVFEYEAETFWGSEILSPDLKGLDFLKAGHHGSGNSTGAALARLCSPQALFVSCGAGNSYGHPALSAMQRVLDASPRAQIYRTDEAGNIVLTIDRAGGYSVTAETA